MPLNAPSMTFDDFLSILLLTFDDFLSDLRQRNNVFDSKHLTKPELDIHPIDSSKCRTLSQIIGRNCPWFEQVLLSKEEARFVLQEPGIWFYLILSSKDLKRQPYYSLAISQFLGLLVAP
jgi:hypothetical protein